MRNVFGKNFYCLLLIFSLLLPLPSRSRGTSSRDFLQINQYYILYTDTIVPYRDSNGTFMVGIHGLSQIMAGKVTSNASGTVAILEVAGHSIRFSAGSKQASIDGRPIFLSSPASLNKPLGSMVIPISVLYKLFKVRANWNAKCHILSLKSSVLTRGVDNSDWASRVRGFERPISTRSIIVPTSIELQSKIPLPHLVRLAYPINAASSKKLRWLTLVVKNISFNNIGAGKAYINITSGGGGGVYGQFGMNPPFPSDIAMPNPALHAGATRGAYVSITTGYTPGGTAMMKPSRGRLPSPIQPPTSFVVAWLLVKQ